jgi:hypothetical protein
MTGPDDAPDGFLERWSRRKIDAEREPTPPAGPGAADAPPPDQAVAKAAPQPGFDLASLPSLDSITSATDIRQFLSPGVPKELALAALRRAWAADPAIRDFVGLAENAWDFTDPAAMPGFGPLPEGYDVKSLVARILGGGPQAELMPSSTPQFASNSEPSVGSEPPTIAPPAPASEPKPRVPDIVRRDNNIATHNGPPEDAAEETKTPRQHGGALPQ